MKWHFFIKLPTQFTDACRWAAVCLALLLPTCAIQALFSCSKLCGAELQFVTTEETFTNPERGFYRFRSLTVPVNYAGVRASGQTLVYGQVIASEFRDGPLSEAFLAQIQTGFDAAREAGVKVKFRLAYNDGMEADAPKEIVLQHILQLQPLWEKNKDVLYVLDAGFIGAWGEWHSSTNGLTSAANKREILNAILKSLPQERMVGLRTPQYKREIFNGSAVSDDHVVTSDNAFDGSNLSRVGHLNDCFLSSSNDVGTYVNPGGQWPLDRELDYIGGESRYVPFGGETCGLHERNESSAALAEMARLHIDYLNLDYNTQVIRRWKTAGAFNEIDQRLGYRYELKTATLPDAVRPGSLLPLSFSLDNVGFGELFNPRPLEIALRNTSNGKLMTARLSADPRRWAGGESHSVATHLTLPADLPDGTYAVGIWLPDASDRLRNDARYAIRFANDAVWDGATGINWLTTELRISRTADGILYAGLASFGEVLDLSTLKLLGDFDGDGDVDAEDIDVMSSSIRNGTNDRQFDLNADGISDRVDRDRLLSEVRNVGLGDANLDGVFNSTDLVQVFQAGTYGNTPPTEVGWAAGDWDGDGRFNSNDLVAAMQQGRYEQVKPTSVDAQSVPEPQFMSWALLFSGVSLRRLFQPSNFGR